MIFSRPAPSVVYPRYPTCIFITTVRCWMIAFRDSRRADFRLWGFSNTSRQPVTPDHFPCETWTFAIHHQINTGFHTYMQDPITLFLQPLWVPNMCHCHWKIFLLLWQSQCCLVSFCVVGCALDDTAAAAAVASAVPRRNRGTRHRGTRYSEEQQRQNALS